MSKRELIDRELDHLGRFVTGDVVVLNFPFSDLSRRKRRPALVPATLQGADVILCQITSQTASI
jgi:mRNA interferase MazF